MTRGTMLTRPRALTTTALRPEEEPDVIRDLSEADVDTLLAISQRRTYERGELIVECGQEEDAIFVIVRGKVDLFVQSAEGRRALLYQYRRGTVFELGGLNPESDSETIAEAAEHGTVVYTIPWAHFLEVVSVRPIAASSLAILLRQGVLKGRALISELAFHDIKTRVAHRLAEIAESVALSTFRVTREELAISVGTRPEQVAKAMRALRAEGLLTYQPHGRAITLLDVTRLSEYRTRRPH